MSSRLYKLIIAAVDKRVPQIARPFWEYEAGPKTIFFVKKNIFSNLLATFFCVGAEETKKFLICLVIMLRSIESRILMLSA